MFFFYVFGTWALVITHLFLRTQGLLGIRGKGRVLFLFLFYLAAFSYLPARILVRSDPANPFVATAAYGASVLLGFMVMFLLEKLAP